MTGPEEVVAATQRCPPGKSAASSGLAAKVAGAFVLLSVVAALLPVRRYVARLSRDEFVLWSAAVAWVLALPVALVAVLRLLRCWLGRRAPPGPPQP
jgi:hypothetical protein